MSGLVKQGEVTLENGQIMEIFTDGKNIVKTCKSAPAQTLYKTKYSHLNFIERFSDADQLRYAIKYKDIINANTEITAEEKQTYIDNIELTQYKFDKATYIDLTDERVENYLNMLVACGVLVTTNVEDVLTPNEIIG
jgi:hypothetical protein